MKQAMLYGGPNDGAGLDYEVEAPQIALVRLPVKGTKYVTRYELSPAWSQHFNKPVLVPSTFPGKPPKQTQAA